MGIRLIIYLDDILIMSESREKALEHTTMTVNLLSSLGFVVNEDKSVFQPTHELQFLGFLVNSVTMSLYPPKRQSKGYQEGLSEVDRQPFSVKQSPVSAGEEINSPLQFKQCCA